MVAYSNKEIRQDYNLTTLQRTRGSGAFKTTPTQGLKIILEVLANDLQYLEELSFLVEHDKHV